MQAIIEHDKALAILRESWRDAIPARKSHWMGLINQALDERLKLMQLRDGEKAAEACQPTQDITTALLIALQDCVAVMEEELAGMLAGMKVIQPELRAAQAVIARATGKDGVK